MRIVQSPYWCQAVVVGRPIKLSTVCLELLVVVAALGGTNQAIAVDQFWVPVGVDDWYAGAGPGGQTNNWLGTNGGFIPKAEFSEVAVIDNGGTAYVDFAPNDSASQPLPGRIVLGQSNGTSGSLEIRSGGVLSALPCTDTGICGGEIVVGQSGTGSLIVQPGGSLSGQTFTLGGGASSSLTIGGAAGGAATLQSAGNLNLNRSTRVIGPNASVSAAASAILGGSSQLIAEITSPSAHSPITGTTSATVAGELVVEFGAGVTPSSGDAWSLIDAPSISGSFSSIDLSNAAPLPAGSGYRVREVAGGLGSILQLEVTSFLVASVDWDTGDIKLENPGNSPISIDGYSLLSDLGVLNDSPANWNSLQEQAFPGWEETATSANAISELRSAGASSLQGDFSVNLGSIFQPIFTEFQSDPADLSFEYREADGTITQGFVEYEGLAITNNLRLTVDPTNGEGQLKNDSPFTVTIDGFSILSDGGSLTPGSWDGIGLPGWEEAAPSAQALSELLPAVGESLELLPGEAYDLGDLFNTAGSQDLELEFRTLDGPLAGIVTYGDIQESLPGDFNRDGTVDAADYTVWRDGLGVTYTEDQYDAWAANYGRTANALSTAVPEPTSAVLFAASALAGLCRRRA